VVGSMSVLQCVAVRCITLQCFAVFVVEAMSVGQCFALCCVRL